MRVKLLNDVKRWIRKEEHSHRLARGYSEATLNRNPTIIGLDRSKACSAPCTIELSCLTKNHFNQKTQQKDSEGVWSVLKPGGHEIPFSAPEVHSTV